MHLRMRMHIEIMHTPKYTHMHKHILAQRFTDLDMHTSTHTHTHTHTCTFIFVFTTARDWLCGPLILEVSQYEATRLVAPLVARTPTLSPQLYGPSAVEVLTY